MQNNNILARCASCGAPLQMENLTGLVIVCEHCNRQHIVTADSVCKQTCEFYWKPVSNVEDIVEYSLWKIHGKKNIGNRTKNRSAVSVELIFAPIVDIRGARSEVLFHDFDHIKSEVDNLENITSMVESKNRIGTHELRRDYSTSRILPVDGNILKNLTEQYGQKVSPVIKYLPFYVVRIEGSILVLNACRKYVITDDKSNSVVKNYGNIIYKIISWLYVVAAIIGGVVVYQEFGHEYLNVYIFGALWIVVSIIAYFVLLIALVIVTIPIDMIKSLFK